LLLLFGLRRWRATKPKNNRITWCRALLQTGILDDISKQMGLWAQLRHIAGELRGIRGGGAARKASALRAMLRWGFAKPHQHAHDFWHADFWHANGLVAASHGMSKKSHLHRQGIIPEIDSRWRGPTAAYAELASLVLPCSEFARSSDSKRLQQRMETSGIQIYVLCQRSPSGACAELANLVLPCPLDSGVQLTGIVPSECSVFKSAMTPLRLAFRTADGAARSKSTLAVHLSTVLGVKEPQQE